LITSFITKDKFNKVSPTIVLFDQQLKEIRDVEKFVLLLGEFKVILKIPTTSSAPL
jgi:hypothetical protein